MHKKIFILLAFTHILAHAALTAETVAERCTKQGLMVLEVSPQFVVCKIPIKEQSLDPNAQDVVVRFNLADGSIEEMRGEIKGDVKGEVKSSTPSNPFLASILK